MLHVPYPVFINNMYRMSADKVDRSNKRARIASQAEKAWCANHLGARPNKNFEGTYYKQCWTGYSKKEECKIMIVKPDGTEVENEQ